MSKFKFKSIFLLITSFAGMYIAGCNQNSVTNPGDQTDNQYLQNVIQSGYCTNDRTVEDNLMSNTVADMDTGAVSDDGGYNIPLVHIIQWGRHITDVNINLSISNEGDTMKTVAVERTITGYYRIIGLDLTGNQVEVDKPYVEQTNRNIAFKRVARTPHPRFNWRVYSYLGFKRKNYIPFAYKYNNFNQHCYYRYYCRCILYLNRPGFYAKCLLH